MTENSNPDALLPGLPGGAPALPRPRTNGRAAHGNDPWAALPRDLAPKLRPGAAEVAHEILREIQRSIPEYARPLEGAFGKVVTEGIGRAVTQFIERVADPTASHESDANLFRRLGRLETTEGRGVETLQTAYHVGARVAWQRIAEFGQATDLPVSTICLLGETLFAYIEEISALSVEGYAAAKARAAGALERRRRRLLELVLAAPAVPRQALADLAGPANWELPEHVVAVALARRENQRELPALAFDERVLADLDGGEPCLIVADPGPRSGALETGLCGWQAAVGPRVRLADAPLSLRQARWALDLVRRGILADNSPVWCEAHLSTFWLLADEFVARALAERTLAPLAPLTAKQRARLGQTLLAWLQTRGGAPEIAQRLGIHPQTVRYRLHQLKTLFGDRLNDPEERFELEISLRAQRLLDAATPPAVS
ncbi:helix-turn-helix domain-containing protein [Amycolatopsis anabasis]|uniref:PucR family transcriptional regulator n=1 Tax=Amycolatopsis anabasis TaxID=1840409 RepID=UPI001FE5B600|nr:PucR family transcriptional regulator [Amycolatopsis anabasis]